MAQIEYGVDIVLDNSGDIVFADNGDLLNTLDIEQTNPNKYQFEGQYNISTSLYNRLVTQLGDYQFDPTFGSNILAQISSTSMFVEQSVKDFVKRALEEDSRVKEVKSIKTKRDGNRLSVNVKVRLIGSNIISEFVFPDIYLD